MNASSYIGRVGGLAAALGVGVAVFTGAGAASAAPAASGSSDSSTSASGSDGASSSTGSSESGAASGATTKPKAHKGPLAAIFGAHGSSASTPKGSEPDSTQGGDDSTGTKATPRPKKDRPFSKSNRTSTSTATSSGTTTSSGTPTDTTDTTADVPVKKTFKAFNKPAASPDVDTSASSVSAVVSSASTARSSLSTLVAKVPTQSTTPTSTTPAARLSTVIATVVDQLLHPFSGNAPGTPAADTPISWMMLAASRRELAGTSASLAQVSATTAKPVLVLNGLSYVPTTPQNSISLYGMFTNFPGFQGVVQGEQDFDLVDKNGATVGSVTALVSRNNSIGFNQKYVQLVVTANDVEGSGSVGTGAGQVPPVGSVITSYGSSTFGTVYSSMPSSSGDVVSYKGVTPLGDFPLFTSYDAAADLTDYVSFNRPVKLGDGAIIKATTPNSAEFTSVTGFPPFFNAIQGSQNYTFYKPGSTVAAGSFTGLTTVTSDVLGTYTEAIIVTANDGVNVGTGADQAPPVGTVYNVIYFHSDDLYVIYSAKPSTTGPAVTSTKLVSPDGVTPLNIKFDATPEPQRTITVPGRYTFVPVGDKQIVGVNGLPPREVIIQGYQQFNVVDQNNHVIGTFDADVSSQHDVSGGATETVLVTNVTPADGVAIGTGAGQVPPVGSVFNFDYQSNPKFYQAYSAMPSANGDVINYKYVTPFGTIPLFTSYDAAKGLSDPDQFTFYDPFNLMSLSAVQSPLASSADPADCTNLLAACTAV